MNKSITAESLWVFIHEMLQAKGCRAEIIDGKCHVLNISEEQYEWKFNDIKYRVYHSDGYCFDVERHYVDSSENIDSGLLYKSEEGFQYEVYPEVWDGFNNKEPLTIAKCFQILKEAFPNNYPVS